MMHQKGGYLYYEGDDFQALDLPYKGEQLSMLVVLPRKKDGLASLESQMGRWRHLPAGDGRAWTTKRRSSSRSPASRWRRNSS